MRALTFVLLVFLTEPLAAAQPWALTRYPNNPIIDRGPSTAFDAVQIGPRHVIKEAPGVYKMWYEGVPAGNAASVGYATSTDGLTWTKYPGNPVLNPGAAWEGGAGGETSPEALLFENGLYKLWYHGFQSGIRRIGYATSPDGIVWTKYAGNPVLDVGAAGAWDATQASDPRVLHVGSQYVMFYIGGKVPPGTTGQIYSIGRATSADGITWTKDAQPVMTASQAWENGSLGPIGVLYENAGYKGWYAAGFPADATMGYATSADGVTWTKYPGNPVLQKSGIAGAADEDAVGDGVTVYRDGNEYRVMYGGFGGAPKHISVCLATSAADPSPDAGTTMDAAAVADAAGTLDGSPGKADDGGSARDGGGPASDGGCACSLTAHGTDAPVATALFVLACLLLIRRSRSRRGT